MEEVIQIEEVKQVKRFDLKTELKVIEAIDKVFKVANNPYSEEESLKLDRVWFMDAANVCGIQAKSEESKRVLSRFMDKDIDIPKLPVIDYETGKEGISKSLFSTEYLLELIKIFNESSESLEITIRREHPIKLENPHFIVYLANERTND